MIFKIVMDKENVIKKTRNPKHSDDGFTFLTVLFLLTLDACRAYDGAHAML